jgi:2-polyprenyl-6-hydroxyphenyl methylase/3-demethylubiquinone-9 3-methyltransferase
VTSPDIIQPSKAYYAKKLGGIKLEKVYELANDRVHRYLREEIDHIASMLEPGMNILELGCGYGRVLSAFTNRVKEAWGIDNSAESLALAAKRYPDLYLRNMDAGHLAFGDDIFDLVFGVQNFISACKVEPQQLLLEAMRVTKPGGEVILTSYASQFWPHRLAWFETQADHGLLGEIDYQATGDGVIVCTDGFKATTFSPDNFKKLASLCKAEADIYTIDNSSVVFEAKVTRR